MANPAIEIRGASKRYGEVKAVNGVDLAIQPGEVFGLIGHNGAGKSTLFKLLLGIVAASAGEIRIEGTPVRGSQFREVRRRLGYLPENVVLYDNLSGLETLQFFAALKGAPRQECVGLLERVGLAQAGRRRVRGYSKGMRQRLGFAQALLGNPRLLVLDEPTNGLDPEGIRAFYRIVQQLRGQGVTIVISSHILTEIQQRVDRLAIMKNGTIQALGTVASLRAQLDLPLRIEVQLAAAPDAALQQALAGLAADIVASADRTLEIHCPRHAKMRVVAALAARADLVVDLQLHEPSLEDVLLGHSG